MRWHSFRGRFRECPDPPYLLDGTDVAGTAGLSSLDLEALEVDVTACSSEREIARLIGTTLGFPESFNGGWDAFSDLLNDFVVEPGRSVVVNVLGADDLAIRDMRGFARLVWILMTASESVEIDGAGAAQLEFLFWGDWRLSRG